MDIEIDAQPSPQQRLEATRDAIARQLARRRRKPRATNTANDGTLPTGMLGRVRRASRVWWHSHPVHTAVDFARPALEDYAEHRPYRLVGIAAGTGVALALLGAWRLLPLGGIALALMKSSDIKATARSFATPSDGLGE